MRGTASGRLTLGDVSRRPPHGGPHERGPRREDDRVPFPITIRGGKASDDGDGFSVTDLRGSLGVSTVSGLTGRLALGKTPALSIRGATARIALGELYPWIASHDGIRETVKPVRSVEGVVEIATLSCDGPLREPGVDVRGQRERGEPGGGYPCCLDPSRSLAAIPHPTGRALLYGRRCVPSRHDVPGGVQLREYTRGVDRITASLHGDVGVEAAKWASSRLGIRIRTLPGRPSP